MKEIKKTECKKHHSRKIKCSTFSKQEKIDLIKKVNSQEYMDALIRKLIGDGI